MSSPDRLVEALKPVLQSLTETDLNQSGAAHCLNNSHAISSPEMQEIREIIRSGIESGWFAPRGEPGMKWGRLAKSSPETLGFSIDGVLMSQPGPGHTHPNGEYDLCLAMDGAPLFDGKPEGWVVYPPESWHIPTVKNGTMAILYFLPDGAIEFGPKKT